MTQPETKIATCECADERRRIDLRARLDQIAREQARINAQLRAAAPRRGRRREQDEALEDLYDNMPV